MSTVHDLGLRRGGRGPSGGQATVGCRIETSQGWWDVEAELVIVDGNVAIAELHIVGIDPMPPGGLDHEAYRKVPLGRLRRLALGEPGALPAVRDQRPLGERLADMSPEDRSRFGEMDEQAVADLIRWTLGVPPSGADPVARRRPGRRRDLVDLARWAVAYEDGLRVDGGKRINRSLAAAHWPDEYARDPDLATRRARDRVKAAREAELLTAPSVQGRPGGRATELAHLLIETADLSTATQTTTGRKTGRKPNDNNEPKTR